MFVSVLNILKKFNSYLNSILLLRYKMIKCNNATTNFAINLAQPGAALNSDITGQSLSQKIPDIFIKLHSTASLINQHRHEEVSMLTTITKLAPFTSFSASTKDLFKKSGEREQLFIILRFSFTALNMQHWEKSAHGKARKASKGIFQTWVKIGKRHWVRFRLCIVRKFL